MPIAHVFAIPPGATGLTNRTKLRQGPRAFGEPARKRRLTPADDGDNIVDEYDAASSPNTEESDSDAEKQSKAAGADDVSSSADDGDGDMAAPVLARAARRLQSLDPPLYNAPRLRGRAPHRSANTDLPERHAGLLACVLHTSLLRGDFARARRAWALLLRAATGAAGLDLRRVETYGIGAEVLLRAAAQGGDDELDERGFEAAKRFYETLIAEYSDIQHRRRNFYSALFSVWLYQVVERTKRRRRAAIARHKRDRAADSGDAMDLDSSSQNDGLAEHLHGANEAELLDAREIGERFDTALEAPQHLDNPELLHLRAGVYAWTADLLQRKLDAMDSGNVDEDELRERLFQDLDHEKSQAQAMLGRARDIQDRALQ